jgi:hypothetical protein
VSDIRIAIVNDGKGLIEAAGVVYHVIMKVDADLRQRRFVRLAP